MTQELTLLLPELTLLALACLILIIDTFQKENTNITFFSAEFALLIVGILIYNFYPDNELYAFNGTFVSDSLSASIKISICVFTIFALYYSDAYLCEHRWNRGEYYVLALFAVLGMFIMASAASLITVYLGLELLSLSLYAMVAMHRESLQSSEAAMKYFILGAIASGLLLYGISIVYGVTGSIELSVIKQTIQYNQYDPVLLSFALVFIIAAIAFKFGAAPFHMWVPDVYQGAPTAIVVFISSVPKIAAFTLVFRILGEGALIILNGGQNILIVIALLSIAIGNIVAIAQTNIKRMLAYSTISHMGFLILGILSIDNVTQTQSADFSDALFYVLSYALMSMAVFGIIILVGRRDKEANELSDYKGLSARNPWFAFILLILMFSMAGVPPFIGFWAKLYVLQDIINAGYIWLAIVAVFFSIIGAYYYLRVVKIIYFDKAETLTAIKATQTYRAVISLNGLAIVFFGIFPGMLMSLCESILK